MMRRGAWPLLAVMSADGLSRLGSSLTAVAIPWFVLVTTGSAARTGVTAFAEGLGVVLALFFGGAIVDRLAYRRASVVADLTAGLAIAVIPALYHTLGLPFGLLLALVFLGALLNTPAQLARYSALPELAARANLRFARANALFEGFLSAAALVGPALAGVLIALLGAGNVLWLDAGSFGVSALLLLAVPRAVLTPAAPGAGYWRELAAGIRALRGDAVLYPLVLYFAAINLAIGPIETLIVPVYAREIFNSPVALGLMSAAGALGALGGNVLYGWVGERLSRRRVFALGFLTVPLVYAALALRPGLTLTLAILGALGLALSVTNLLEYAIYFERMPESMRARLLGLTGALGWGPVPLGRLGAGALLGWLGLVPALALLAAVFLPVPLAVYRLPELECVSASGLKRET
ncbi:MAG TPA: MFS transporter [Thermomicrobiaceae bacterium]|nr:MFS transporter [Thermomicrobiaceae bacterium]